MLTSSSAASCALCSHLSSVLGYLTLGDLLWVPLNLSLILLLHLVHESPAKLFLTPHLWNSREKVLCRHGCGCSSCHLMGWWKLGREGLAISVSQKVLYRGAASAESPLPTRKRDFEISPYKSFWQLFLLGTQSAQHCEFSQVFPWHAINVLSDEMS